MLDKIKTNWRKLRDQLLDARDFIEIDIDKGREFWSAKKYGRALHSWTFGIVGEIYEHAHRWIFYRDLWITLGVAVWIGLEFYGVVNLVEINWLGFQS